jgi:hypothetical protein
LNAIVAATPDLRVLASAGPNTQQHSVFRWMASLQLPVVIGTPDRAIEGPIRLHQFDGYFPSSEPFLDMRISIKCARRDEINSHQ